MNKILAEFIQKSGSKLFKANISAQSVETFFFDLSCKKMLIKESNWKLINYLWISQ